MEIRVFERAGLFAPQAVEFTLERTHMTELTSGFPQGIGRDASAGDRFEPLYDFFSRTSEKDAPALGSLRDGEGKPQDGLVEKAPIKLPEIDQGVADRGEYISLDQRCAAAHFKFKR